MIVADRNELEMQVKRAALQVREKELISFTDNFSVLSTQSVFLTGLGYAGLTMTPVWYSNRVTLLQVLFYTSITISIGLNVMTMCVTSWSMIFGPGLGVRGPEGSMKRAVLGMYSERKWALRFYWAGLAFMMIAGVFLSWLKYGCLFQSQHHWRSNCYTTPVLMTLTFLGFSTWVYCHLMYVTRPRFKFADTKDREEEMMMFGDFDPEQGKVVDSKGPAIREDEKQAVSEGIKRIEWLQEQGLVSPEEAKAQKSAIIAKFALPGANGVKSLGNEGTSSAGASSKKDSTTKKASSSFFLNSKSLSFRPSATSSAASKSQQDGQPPAAATGTSAPTGQPIFYPSLQRA